ncbi:uncharacterized protein LOC135706625 [Ochlerotatus camptorhynchus]|uniref:uncharacterized protein LOC135706625 n=1 Tax=Ochlerotatus camptorhynchus TaxID=644619 RepID=UPI0031D16264
MPSKSSVGALKLCKRTYYLQNGTVPTQSTMRQELGSEMANVILECMSPACQAWMGVDRRLRGPSEYCMAPDELKSNIHEHILNIGRQAEDRLDRRRRRMVKKKNIDIEELEFVKFECRQKIEIARDEERKIMEQQLFDAQAEMGDKFQTMKKELEEDFCRERREMSKIMCRNLRSQARELIVKIAKQYREKIENEVTERVDKAILKIHDQLDVVVRTAVQKQKDVDLKEMRKMSYRYEELLKNVQHREACRQLTTLAQQICSKWIETSKHAFNPEISCQTSLVMPEVEHNVESNAIDDSEGFVESSSFLETDDMFVIEACFMMPGPSPVYSLAVSGSEYESETSSSTLEAITFEGNVYAQPEYYRKFHEKLFPTPMLKWESIKLDEQFTSTVEELTPIDSDFTREVTNQILANQDLEEKEIVLATLDLEVLPSSQRYFLYYSL